MAYSISPPANTDFFSVWFNATVSLCNAMSALAVTVDTTANGAYATGNGFVTGILGATTLLATTIQGGTVNTYNANVNVNSNLIINSGLNINFGNLFANSTLLKVGNSSINATLNSTALIFNGGVGVNSSFITTLIAVSGGTVNTTTTGTGSQIVDSFLIANSRSASYTLQVTDNIANNYQVSDLLIIYDGTNADVTEYGINQTNSAMGTYTASANATSVILNFTPVSANTTIKGIRSLLPV